MRSATILALTTLIAVGFLRAEWPALRPFFALAVGDCVSEASILVSVNGKVMDLERYGSRR